MNLEKTTRKFEIPDRKPVLDFLNQFGILLFETRENNRERNTFALSNQSTEKTSHGLDFVKISEGDHINNFGFGNNGKVIIETFGQFSSLAQGLIVKMKEFIELDYEERKADVCTLLGPPIETYKMLIEKKQKASDYFNHDYSDLVERLLGSGGGYKSENSTDLCDRNSSIGSGTVFSRYTVKISNILVRDFEDSSTAKRILDDATSITSEYLEGFRKSRKTLKGIFERLPAYWETRFRDGLEDLSESRSKL